MAAGNQRPVHSDEVLGRACGKFVGAKMNL
jgi:hypothetical protein